jgi:hypothetical protein
MVDEAMGVDEPCAVCAIGVEDCLCPECPMCGEQGNPKCYYSVVDTTDFPLAKKIGHGLMLSKEQVISRQKAYIRTLENRVYEEGMALEALEASTIKEWDIMDVIDPWGG